MDNPPACLRRRVCTLGVELAKLICQSEGGEISVVIYLLAIKMHFVHRSHWLCSDRQAQNNWQIKRVATDCLKSRVVAVQAEHVQLTFLPRLTAR